MYAETGNHAAGKVVVAYIYLFNLGYQTAYGALYYSYMCPPPSNLYENSRCGNKFGGRIRYGVLQPVLQFYSV